MAAAQRPASRITQQIDPNRRVTLEGNTPALTRGALDRGPAPSSLLESRMLLVLARSDEQEQALRQLLEEQQTAGSPNFHKWLTPEEFGQKFGPSDADLQTVTTWLLNSGFQVTEVSPGRNVIEFSGTAGQLRQVFHTDIHKYVIHGAEHWANANDPQIPAALAPVVKGIASLNNFGLRPQSHTFDVMKRDIRSGETTPLITTSGSPVYYPIGPADFSVIYGSNTLLQAGYNGSGQTIAIVGRTNINPQDVTDFRTLFGLPMTPDNHTSVVLNGPDPGIVHGDQTESLLDVEWAGAVAPGASIVLVASESTTTVDGVDLSALYIVQHNLAPVMSVSYGSCESQIGNAGNLFYQSLWEQAAAQGITVVVAAGDNGSAGCDDPNSETVASHGAAVSGLASTPFNVAVGGTDFNDGTTQTTYFNSTNSAGYLSAKSYIPEMTWNDSCAGGASPSVNSCTNGTNLKLWAGSGGPSTCSKVTGSTCSGTAKPAWQTGTGVPNDNVRDIPDISFFAEGGVSTSRSFYVLCEADKIPPGYQSCVQSGGYVHYVPIGGTSAGAPTFAGAVALANQKLGKRLGNLNYLLYSIAAQSAASCSTTPSSCVFHDVTVGANTVPCQGGTPNCSAATGNGVLVDSGKLAYLTGAGYDRATGLGSPNITNLVNAIGAASFTQTTTSLTLNGNTTTVQANHGDSINVGVTVSPSAATGDVSLIGDNGISDNLGIDSLKLTSGAANWGSTLFPGGSYTVHAHYAGDGTRGASDSSAIAVNIAPENSKTFVNLVTFDLTGHLTSFTATSAEYGSPYILRMDVGDSAATISSTTGVSSKCANGTASCPTGTLTVTANGNPLDSVDGKWLLNSAGHSEDQPIQLTPGNYNIVANYPGDASYNASTGSTSLSIGKTGTTVVAGAPTPVKYGAATSLTAEVDTSSNGAAPSGAVSFTENGGALNVYNVSSLGTAGGASGFAKLNASGTFNFMSLGSHNVTANYAGDSNYLASVSQALTFNVVQDDTRIGSIGYGGNFTTGSPVTITASVLTDGAGVQPTGTVTFYDGTTAMNGTTTYSGHDGTQSLTAELDANLTYTFNTAGNHQITAKYSGDTYYLASGSGAAQSLQISGPFNILPGGPITVIAGQTGNTTLTLSSNNGFTGSVTLTCTPSALAAETTCGFSQGTTAAQSSLSVDLTGSNVPVTFSVSTTAAHTIAENRPMFLGNVAGGLMVCGLFVFGIPMFRRKAAAIPTLLLLLLMFTAISCGGGGGSSTPPPRTDPGTLRGAYAFTVTGTTGSGANLVTVPVQVSVTVN
jgi:hypothetical protein